MTISYVLPCVLSLNQHLQDATTKYKSCVPVVKALVISLRQRFYGIFQQTGTEPERNTDCAFGDSVYLLSAVLNPTFNIQWIECDLPGPPDFKDSMRHRLQGRISLYYTYM